ncbi:MAG: hypothetical protein DSZ28_09655 [Thiothrix sp.]|nr:MAG: hypothetical protein DSZ28_09655 [Thiothrix sp.]
MKVKKVAVTAAVCAALLGSQGVMAEEQPIGAEGMGFAFDDAQVSSVQMSKLSGSEMEETEGAWGGPYGWILQNYVYNTAVDAGTYAWDYYQNTVAPVWSSGTSYCWGGTC